MLHYPSWQTADIQIRMGKVYCNFPKEDRGNTTKINKETTALETRLKSRTGYEQLEQEPSETKPHISQPPTTQLTAPRRPHCEWRGLPKTCPFWTPPYRDSDQGCTAVRVRLGGGHNTIFNSSPVSKGPVLYTFLNIKLKGNNQVIHHVKWRYPVFHLASISMQCYMPATVLRALQWPDQLIF